MSSRRDGNPPEALRADPFGSLFGSLFQYCKKVTKTTQQSRKSAPKGVGPFAGGRSRNSPNPDLEASWDPWRDLLVLRGAPRHQNDLQNGSRDTQHRQKNTKNYPPGDTHTQTGLKKKRESSLVFYRSVCVKSAGRVDP